MAPAGVPAGKRVFPNSGGFPDAQMNLYPFRISKKARDKKRACGLAPFIGEESDEFMDFA